MSTKKPEALKKPEELKLQASLSKYCTCEGPSITQNRIQELKILSLVTRIPDRVKIEYKTLYEIE